MTGLALTVIYDDYSTADAYFAEIELLTKGKLSEYNKYVEVRYDGVKARIPVSVTSKEEPTPPTEEEDSSIEEESSTESVPQESGCNSSLMSVGTLMLTVIALAVVKSCQRKEN